MTRLFRLLPLDAVNRTLNATLTLSWMRDLSDGRSINLWKESRHD
jgi:hypothetical protein